MGFLARLFEFIADIIRGAIKGIADTLRWVLNKIKSFMDGIGKWIVMGVIVGFIVAPAAMAAIVAGIGATVKAIAVGVWNAGKWIFTKIVATSKWLSTTFQAFLQAIHFKELLAIHGMAMILSKDYREMMNKVYKEISDFAYEVFGSAEMLHLLLQGSRQLIYSCSSAVGYPVDIAEMEYLMMLDETLQKVSAKAEIYADNPELIFDDIAEWVYKPIGEKYSTINQGFALALEGVIKGVDTIAQKTFQINEQTQQVVSYLPSPIRGKVQDILEPLDEKITNFQYNIYAPKMQELDHAIMQNSKREEQHREKIKGLSDRLINPADYLTELDDLDIEDRDREKRKIDISINEPFDRDREELSEGIDKEIEIIKEEKIRLPEPTTEPPEIMKLEPKKKPIIPGKHRDSWNVGDY